MNKIIQPPVLPFNQKLIVSTCKKDMTPKQMKAYNKLRLRGLKEIDAVQVVATNAMLIEANEFHI